MRQVAGLLVVAVLASVGCGSTPTSAVSEVQPRAFHGKSASKPISWDLTGTWSVLRFGTKENPGKLGRWGCEWHLEAINRTSWRDSNGQGDLHLSRPDTPQTLIWLRPKGPPWYFSINEQSFGNLMMTDDDGERYHAVRTEGGER